MTLMPPSSPREQQLARWLFWSLLAVMLALIYRDLWFGAWSQAADAGGRWWRQLTQMVEEAAAPDDAPVQQAVMPAPAPVPPASAPEGSASEIPAPKERAPQTVGDLIANLQQQDGGESVP